MINIGGIRMRLAELEELDEKTQKLRTVEEL